MNRTGIIYDIQKNNAVVLTSESEFVIVKSRQDMNIGQQVRFENKDIFSPNRRLFFNAVAVTSVAAVFIVILLYFQFFHVGKNGNVYGYIGVDINPSVEFEIKENYQVLKTRPLNEEGKQLTQELDITDKKVEDAISELISKSIEMGFINSGDERIVLVSGALKEGKSEEGTSTREEEIRLHELLNSIKNNIDNNSIEGHIVLVEPEERKYAMEKNISMGKYGLYLEAEELKEGITFEDIYDMSVSEMVDKLSKNGSRKSPGSKETPISTPKPGLSTQNTPHKTDVDSIPTSIETLAPSPTGTGIQTIRPKTSVPPTNTPERSVEPTTKITPTKGGLQIQFSGKANKEISQGVDYSFRMFNTANSEIDLKDVKVRYYFKEDASISDMNSAVYFNSCGYEEDVHCKFYNLSGSKEANKYLEITFSSGSLSPDEILYITGLFYKNDWGEFDQSDDYSYNSGDSYVDWKTMTAYIKDVLVWGQEP